MSAQTPDPRRTLPAVDAVLRDPDLADVLVGTPRALVADAVREAIDARRATGAGADGLLDDVRVILRPSLRPVINATGVALHTNLGRSPLAPEAVAAATAAAGYCTLEWDPVEGERGSRHDHAAAHLSALTGAPASCVANTCAGMVLLALVALCAGREVIVSRGQLVEIGGGFRVPEILAASGCRLVEVGTTNRTRLSDYANAIGPETAAILRVHPSNFRVVGFVGEVDVDELATLARERGLLCIDDLGSGAIGPDGAVGDEPLARQSVAAGCDVVCFSGDKLLGGPQAGIAVGSAPAIERMRSHPLMRALRPDKLTLAALEATLRLHRDPESRRTIPTLAMLAEDGQDRRARAQRLAERIGGEVVASIGRAGGGTLPLAEVESFAVALPDPVELAAALRLGEPAVASRVADGRVLLDVLCLRADDVESLVAAVERARK